MIMILGGYICNEIFILLSIKSTNQACVDFLSSMPEV